MLPANVTETILDTGKLQLTVSRPLTAAEGARYAAYLADNARYQAAVLAQAEARDKAMWDQLGEQPATVGRIEKSGLYDLSITIIGKTAEAVAARVAEYEARWAPHVFLTRLGAPVPFFDGFKATGTRRESV